MLVPDSAPQPGVARTESIIGERSWAAVHHRGIDHLALPRTFPLVERRQDAGEQEHRSAAEVAHQVQWRNRAFTGTADGVQHPD